MFTNVVVAVRHPIMRRGVSAVLGESTDLNVVADVGDLIALNEVCARTGPRIVVIDSMLVSLQSGVSLKDLARRHPLCRFILLWLYDKPTELQKTQAQFNIELEWQDLSALRSAVLDALSSIPSLDFYGRQPTKKDKLTARENEVLENIARGLTTAEIAEQLSISARTAELHRYRICRKLGITSPLELAKFIIRQGLVPL